MRCQESFGITPRITRCHLDAFCSGCHGAVRAASVSQLKSILFGFIFLAFHFDDSDPRRCFDWVVKVAFSSLHTVYICQFNAPDVSVQPGYGSSAVVHLKLCQERDARVRAAAANNHAHRVHTHPRRPQTTLDAKYNKHYKKPSNLSHRVSRIAQGFGLLVGGGVESFQSKLWAVCCDLSTWLNCSACPRFRSVQLPLPVPVPAPCCLPAARPGFVSGICHSVSQLVGRSVSYASQNCLQLGIPYSYLCFYFSFLFYIGHVHCWHNYGLSANYWQVN